MHRSLKLIIERRSFAQHRAERSARRVAAEHVHAVGVRAQEIREELGVLPSRLAMLRQQRLHRDAHLKPRPRLSSVQECI